VELKSQWAELFAWISACLKYFTVQSDLAVTRLLCFSMLVVQIMPAIRDGIISQKVNWGWIQGYMENRGSATMWQDMTWIPHNSGGMI
jgi:hypothetical protein